VLMTSTPLVNVTPLDDFGQLVFALQPVPGLCGGGNQLEDHQPCSVLGQRTLGPHGPMPPWRTRSRSGPMSADGPVLSREVIEGQHHVAIFYQACHRLLVFCGILRSQKPIFRLGWPCRGPLGFLVAIGGFGAPDRDTIDAQALAVVRDEAGEFKLKESLIKSSHREPSA
jgi:hypothetical protein